MSRPHVITRKSDGAFWCGLVFGFGSRPEYAQVFISFRHANRYGLQDVAQSPRGEHPADCFIEPASWYSLPSSEQIQ